ncbi:MAG: ATP-binding protein, partial [Armatimonadota bacterium]|nr:ATP-binding protein [Armatimonadota bacterium]
MLQLSVKAANEDDRKAGLEVGADGYLAEPVEQAELTATVCALLRIRQADEDIRVAARHWRTTFDAISDGVCLLNHDGTVLRCNRTMADLLKLPFNQIIGEPYQKLVLDAMGCADAPTLDRIAETRAREVAEISIEDRWFCVTADPIIDDYAGLTSAVHTWDDITDRKRTDILIAGQKQILEMIATGTPLQEVLLSLTRLIEEQAQEIRAAILLARDDQSLQLGAAPSMPPQFQEMLNQVAINSASGCCGTAAYRREPVLVEDIAKDPLWENVRELALSCDIRAGWATPIFSNTGAILGTLAIYYAEARAPSDRHRHIVEIATQIAGIAIERAEAEESLRRRAEQLSEADRRKDEFLAMLAHELRNPLGVISNALHVMKRQPDIEPSIRRAQEVAERQVQHQVRIVDDLLDVSRINHGKIELKKAVLDLVQLVRETAEPHRAFFAEGGIEHSLELPEEPIWAMADNMRLAQVIDNLLTNTLKFTPRGGSATLRVTKETDDWALVQVVDTGVGLDPEILKHLFEPFAQADHSLDRSRGGLGLGLALVRGLVELHGGQVLAESPGPDKGTTFTLRLPIVAAPEEIQGPSPAAQPPAGVLK